jgi:hypothetical protein
MCHDEDCRCEGHGHQTRMDKGPNASGCCCMPGHERRRFLTHDEMIANLEEYRKDLQLEVKGVEERIAELKNKA